MISQKKMIIILKTGMHGNGTYWWRDGRKYEGEFRFNKKEGQVSYLMILDIHIFFVKSFPAGIILKSGSVQIRWTVHRRQDGGVRQARVRRRPRVQGELR